MHDDDPGKRRPGLTLMPECGVEVPVWFGPDGDGIGSVSAEELRALGLSFPLIERLRAWEVGWDGDPFTSSPPREFWPGSAFTVRLAQRVQAELPGYRIFLDTRDGAQPVEEWAD